MGSTSLVFILAVFLIFISQLAIAWGVTTNTITYLSVETSGGGIGSALFDFVAFVVNNIASILQILTFQVDGINPMVNLFFFVPISIGIGYTVMRLARGGG